jgi:electron transport complex protein RnfA
MISHSVYLALLGVFSSLSMNLVLQCGLGMAGLARYPGQKLPLLETGLSFLTVLLLWAFFSVFPFSMGLFKYVLCFPAASLVHSGLQTLASSLILKGKFKHEGDFLFDNALVAASLFITMNLSGSFAEAAVLSFGFAAGILLAMVILREIRHRSEMEAVPKFLRGSPLAIISMGLLSLCFSSAAFMLFSFLGA